MSTTVVTEACKIVFYPWMYFTVGAVSNACTVLLPVSNIQEVIRLWNEICAFSALCPIMSLVIQQEAGPLVYPLEVLDTGAPGWFS